MSVRRFVVGISGASGPILGIRLLETLRETPGVETHLVVSKGAVRTLQLECPDWPLERVRALAAHYHEDFDLAAAISSGSFLHDGMIIIPASMKTCGNLASGNAGNLLVRAADVTLKERRPLIVVPREAPLHLGHLRALTALAEYGATILPPVLATYHAPQTVLDLVDHVVGKALDLLRVEHRLFRRWNGPA
jgi:4-hydroxy-3-polyprenylbenzoate decarboxylase